MRDKRPETIDDIVADIRAQNQGLPEGSYALSPLVCDLLSIADRIEAAYNFEREAVCENSSHVGNAAAMREALEKVRFYLPYFLQYVSLHREDAAAGGYYERIQEVVTAALSAPPRNCDVGTAEEQSARFDAHCRRHIGCFTCPLREKDGGVPKHCEFAWSQMPYEGGEK